VALTLAQGTQFIASAGYYNRVRSGMVRHARTVMAEAQGGMTVNEWAKRKILANRVLTGPDSMVNAFLSAVASDSAASLTWYQPTLISLSSNANPSVVTTATAHNLTVTDGSGNPVVVEIVGHAGNTNINGVWTVAAVGSATTFTVAHPANAAGTATGWVMRQESDLTVNFTLQSAWSGIAGTYTGDV
jgi:hypothetical protein